MTTQVYLYQWPESQECSECQHGLVVDSDCVICQLNHNKAHEIMAKKECVLFSPLKD